MESSLFEFVFIVYPVVGRHDSVHVLGRDEAVARVGELPHQLRELPFVGALFEHALGERLLLGLINLKE